MKLSVANANISNTLSTARMTLGNASIVESLTLGNVSVTPSQISVGNVSVTPTTVSVPALVLGGGQFSGVLQGGIINYQEFTADGTWYNPYANASVNSALTGYEQVLVMAWGGGGGGASNNTISRSGGGGAFSLGYFTLANLSNTVAVTVGSGGTAARTTTTAVGTAGNGGNSIFSGLTAYGGGGGNDTLFGGGGGALSNGAQTTGGSPLPGTVSTYGGGTGDQTTAGSTIFGGGGAFGASGSGGNSIYGGGGGAAGSASTASGNSVFGGKGGLGSGVQQGSIPAGGGASSPTGAGAGARGEVRVWVFGPAATTAGAPTYALTANTTTLYEGSSVLYTVSTTNVANGTTLYYTLNNSSTAVATDFTTAVNGSVVINGGTGTFTLTANNDTDSANEAFQIDVRTGSTTGSIVVSNGSVSIVPLPPVSLVNRDTLTSIGSTQASYTFSARSIGTASATRRVYALITADNGVASAFRSLSSVTIGGVAATIHVQQTHQSGGFIVSGIASALVTSGTTADVVVNFNDNMVRCGLVVIAVKDVIDATPYDTATSSGTDPASLPIDFRADGLVLIVGGTSNVTTATVAEMTTTFGGGIPSTSSMHGGDAFPTSNTTNSAANIDWASPGQRAVAVALSVR